MGFISELFAFVIVGDARYGRDFTPTDRLNEQAELGLEMIEEDYR